MQRIYVQLSKFNGVGDVDEWLRYLDECISLLGIKGEEAAPYAFYHVTGDAKLYLSMLGDNLTTIKGIKESLQEGYLRIRNRSEIIYELMGTKQGYNKTSMVFSDKLLKLAMELKNIENQWEEIVVESITIKLINIRLRQAMCSLGKDISFKELRKCIDNWEEVSKTDTYESYGVKVGSSQRNWQDGQIIDRNVSLRSCSSRTNYGRGHVYNYIREVRCSRCNILGHISSTCRVDVKEKTSISGLKEIVDSHQLIGECVSKVEYKEESKVGCIEKNKIEYLIDTSSQVSIIPYSFLNKIDNIKVGKPYPWLQIRVENSENVKDSDEGKVEVVRKWTDMVKELRYCMGFVVYTLVYYSKFMIDFKTMTSPSQKFIVDVIN